MCVRLKSFVLIFYVARCIAIAPPYNLHEGMNWKCEPIRIAFCKDLKYNVTVSNYNDENQEDHEKFLKSFQPLIQTRCSKHLRLYLCALRVPLCHSDFPKPITACRSLCEDVHKNCRDTLLPHVKRIPAVFNCSRLKDNKEDQMCLDGGVKKTHFYPTTTTKRTKNTKTSKKSKPTIRRVKTNHVRKTAKITSAATFCRVLYSRNSQNYFYVDKVRSCALGCMKDGLFTSSEKQLAEKWIMALACLCVLMSVLSLFVVVFNYHKTAYPERTISFIVVCYLFYGLAYVIRLVYSREGVSCQEENGFQYLLVDGSGNITCAATFLLAYCFSLAQNIWWIMLCLTWFLSAGMRWNSNAIKSKSSYFHVVAWGVPCAITIVVLVLRKIDVNELTGICSIGNRYENLSTLRAFVLGPLFTFLVMGSMFLLFGFIALLRIPGHLIMEVNARSNLKRPLAPVAVYAALHTFFSTFILASYFYEYFNKAAWYHDPATTGPNYIVFLVRLIMEFFIGLCASLWLLCVHTPPLYKKFKLKLCRSEVVMNSPPDHTLLDPVRSQTDTNETSI